MPKRKLEELNLLDDFLFGSMVTYPEIGEKFIREILRTIFQRDFGRLTVVPQKIYYGSDTDKHGTRLDVYLEEENSDEAATVYDVEPDQNDRIEAIEALPFRIRFYYAKIDAKSLKSGESYRLLKKVIVIMIMPYDPFGRDRMVYTIRNMCEEEPEMPYDDGARTLFLYTKGTKGEASRELRELLHYMEHTTEKNARNESLQGIHQMVQTVKQDEEVSLEYMKIFEREEMLIRQGIEQEKANTERERQRAEQEKVNAERECRRAEKEKANAERERQRAEQEKANAERECQRAEKEKANAECARQRADEAEKEILRLKEEIARMKKVEKGSE